MAQCVSCDRVVSRTYPDAEGRELCYLCSSRGMLEGTAATPSAAA